MATINIIPVEASDIPTLGTDLLYPQKLALTINRLLFKDWPNEPVQKANSTRAVESSFNDPDVECLKAVDEHGDIIGYVALTRKHQPPTNNTVAVPPSDDAADTGTGTAGEGGGKQDGSPPDFFNPHVLSAVQAAVAEINQTTQTTEHYGRLRYTLFSTLISSIHRLHHSTDPTEIELTYIAIKSPHRRRGTGSRLLQICFDRAKAADLPLVVSSEPAAYDFFTALGFRDTKHVDFDLSKWAAKYNGFGLFRLSGMMWTP